MTVREFIEHLQTLDPDKNIWVIYDSTYFWSPRVEVADEYDEHTDGKGNKVKAGDYAIFAG